MIHSHDVCLPVQLGLSALLGTLELDSQTNVQLVMEVVNQMLIARQVLNAFKEPT